MLYYSNGTDNNRPAELITSPKASVLALRPRPRPRPRTDVMAKAKPDSRKAKATNFASKAKVKD